MGRHQSENGGFGRAYPIDFSPKPEEPVDTLPRDRQPPGVDEEVDYNSLEEALTG